MQKQKIQKFITLGILSFFISGILTPSFVYAAEGDQTTVVGLKKSQTTKILDNFKDQENILLFQNVPFSSDDELGLFNAERKMNSLNDILKRINSSKEQYKEQKREVTREKFTLKKTIRDLDSSIAETEKSIADTEELIAEKNREIAKYSMHIDELNAKIEENKASILRYLTYIYTKGDLIYDGTQNIDVLRSIILNDGNLGEIFNDIHYKSVLEMAGQNFIEVHRNLIKEYFYNKESLKKEKLLSVRLKRQLITKNNDISAQKKYKEQLLEVTKGQEALFNQYIASKQRVEENMQGRLEAISEEYTNVFARLGDKYQCNVVGGGNGKTVVTSVTGYTFTDSGTLLDSCNDLQKFYAAEKQLIDYPIDETVTNPLVWPVEATRISTYFHDEEYFKSLGSEHEAIDVPMPQGSDIVAPAAGYVYFIQQPTPGGYGYIALKHANGYVTVYGHISEVLVNKFDFIDTGRLFAKTGGTPGTPGAGVMTSGAHLHFELYKNRESADPLRLLDLTRLNYDSIEGKYRYKFVEDLKARYGNKTNISKYSKFLITGENEIERQEYLLANYADGRFANIDVWTEEAVGGKIDPSFLMCVGLAETGLGNHLKTAYNIGNIGNTDSGSTYEFMSARDGIYWMVKTLNNKFLGKYTTIDQLSRYGNKDGSIYASSSSNWHNNVVRCLSALKGRFVEDNFQFRLAEDGKDE
ncbi:MAG: peptidoglycan DD-metalloendopeptidase family protein [Candidatus Gracilibacteria bacterium]|nr:peptidoglycan DD-metalloendopeptidase family protein [Candidatus Gracilibacteria bacterium]